jgi:dTDP-D-glucose 4,6-dehydratase
MELFVTSGAGLIGSNFIRHNLGVGNKYEAVNYDKLSYSFLNGLRVRQREDHPVR